MTPITILPPSRELNFRYAIKGDDVDPSTFDVQPADQKKGPSPYAFTPKEGPSVLKSWAPKTSTGKLDGIYKFTETTPEIGRTYYDINLKDVLHDDQLLHDLAVTVSERGVVFFADQKDLTVEEHKLLVHKLGLAGGKPKTSGLHIHPTALAGGVLTEENKIDPEIYLVSSELDKRLFADPEGNKKRVYKTDNLYTPWHTDITFEPVPTDYSSLRLIDTPSGNGTAEERAGSGGGLVGGSGGDTLFASGYGLAERVSPAFLQFLETLTGEFAQAAFGNAASQLHIPLYSANRGAPENEGDDLVAHHPIVRTNPTTGWKSLFAIGMHFKGILELEPAESLLIQKYLLDLLVATPEIQLRYKWNVNDLAIWDNRSTFHAATYDKNVREQVPRTGLRATSVGERPFFDPKSKLRSEALRERAEAAAANKRL